ncbi:peptide methionine sulfoxide reductase [Halobacteriales archaeon SW_7_68_16]|nr:MAG: peptide methionine sulfoxide reductase [Halobacteriales archaeon SW_7_68_16]
MNPMPEQIRAYDAAAPDPTATETATVALGCFWGPDARFGAIDGVVRTRVGYAGGTDDDPTYDAIGDHTEALQVTYDPDRCSFVDLVAVAVDEHDPTGASRKRQYDSILFHHDGEQAATIAAALDDLPVDRDAIATRVERLDGFTVAEPYHQKFQLRSKRWITDTFDGAGYDATDVRESPAAAVLNAYAGGHEGASDPRLDGMRARG